MKTELEEILYDLKHQQKRVKRFFKSFKQFGAKFNKNTQVRQCLVERNNQLDILEEDIENTVKKIENLI